MTSMTLCLGMPNLTYNECSNDNKTQKNNSRFQFYK